MEENVSVILQADVTCGSGDPQDSRSPPQRLRPVAGDPGLEIGAAASQAPLFREMRKLLCSVRWKKRFIKRRTSMWFLGMDVGTGGTRAVVVDAAGKLGPAHQASMRRSGGASGMGGAGSGRLVARGAGGDSRRAGAAPRAARTDCGDRADRADARRGDAGRERRRCCGRR